MLDIWYIRGIWLKVGAVLALAAVAASALAVAALVGIDFDLDGEVVRALRHVRDGNPAARYRLWHAPLYLDALSGWMALGGESLIWLRWSSALLLGAGVAFWQLGCRNFLGFGGRAVLWIAAALGGGLILWFDRFLTPFSPIWAVWCGAGAMAWLTVRAARRENAGMPSFREWGWCGVAAGVIFWCSAPAGAIAAAVIGWETGGRRKFWIAAAGWVIVALLAVFALGFDPVRQMKSVYWALVIWSRTAKLNLLLPAGLALWFGWWLIRWKMTRQSERMAGAFAGAGLVLTVFLLPDWDKTRLLLCLIPAAVLVLWRIQRLPRDTGLPAVWAAVILVVLCGGYSLVRSPGRWPAYRQAAAPLAARGVWIPAGEAAYFERVQFEFVRLPGRLMLRPMANGTGAAWWELFGDSKRFPLFPSWEAMRKERPLMLVGDVPDAAIFVCKDSESGRTLALVELPPEIWNPKKGADQ